MKNYRVDGGTDIPKAIVVAYNKVTEAEKQFSIACANHAPECVFKEGEDVYYKRSGRIRCGTINTISYDPYRWAAYGGWYITIVPKSKGWVMKKYYVAHLHPKNYEEIFKA